jgi:hypothetical protein
MHTNFPKIYVSMHVCVYVCTLIFQKSVIQYHYGRLVYMYVRVFVSKYVCVYVCI